MFRLRTYLFDFTLGNFIWKTILFIREKEIINVLNNTGFTYVVISKLTPCKYTV